MRRYLLIAALVCLAAVGPQVALAAAEPQRSETFSGGCRFDATDEFTQPLLPLQVIPGTLRGSGTCHGTVVDASGSHELSSAPAHLVARRSGPGGCLGASNVGSGQLTLPYGKIDFTVTETFIGAVGVDHLTGTAGGSGTMLLTLLDRYDVVAQHCLDGSTQKPHFVVTLNSPSISG